MTNEQIAAVLWERERLTPTKRDLRMFRLGYEAMRKRAAEVCRAFPLPHAPHNLLADEIAKTIERDQG